MKRHFLSLTLFLFSLPSMAQFDIGLRAGATVFYARGSREQAPAYTFGPQAQLGITDDFGLNLSFLYQTSSPADFSKEGLGESVCAVPLNLMWKVSGGAYNYCFFEFGAEFDFPSQYAQRSRRGEEVSLPDEEVFFNFGFGIRMLTFLQLTIDWHLPVGATRNIDWQQLRHVGFYEHSVLNLSLAVML